MGYGLEMAQMVKDLSAVWETWVLSLGWRDSPGGGHGNPLQCSCPENPHGQRSLAGYGPWGHEESDMTKRLSTAPHCIKAKLLIFVIVQWVCKRLLRNTQ